jgi:hypothetical protein
LDGGENGVQGYICTPHERQSVTLLNYWKKSDNIAVIYFVTATFSDEIMPYFPNKANHYILASYKDTDTAIEDIRKQNYARLSFIFSLNTALFEQAGEKLNYVSIYFTKYSYGDIEIGDLANTIAKRDRVRKGEKTHQSDQKYCERTRRDVGRKGISLNNLVSFSILEKMK